jgi:hypothetical protein
MNNGEIEELNERDNKIISQNLYTLMIQLINIKYQVTYIEKSDSNDYLLIPIKNNNECFCGWKILVY